ncbi:cytochrome c oxidase subunit I [Parvibaculum sp.]|uniref:cytochrome c oxidase subunit I n=1 Tax=Parvibaculum sp. TaxID=2024848 RepID=UPI0027311942|nr:cytochrome c oxidase subunit I [Parvibaculum sp.]MDP1626618.1 cytochrome c oxidase subunit I [Parvibaculum sp.]MDP2150539.1 cytochrome c oxidase subunit I [Parvibaculum sp.]MDP3327825.1 cytochrome c oxidase subunit I [Parvibaculum sp.]
MTEENGATKALRLHRELSAIWGTPPGIARAAAVNHSILGRRFMLTAAAFFAIGGLLAMLIRTQLASAGSVFMDEGLYAQVFTMHGTIMMFLFAIPLIEGLAIYLLPKLLGARDLAFPRLTAYGYWCYLFGGTMLIVALAAGAAPDAGWFMYTPLSSGTYSPGINSDFWLLGVTFVEISAVCAAVEIMVSILKLRAPGMSLGRMPVFAWYMLAVAAMMLFAFPPLILGSILLEVERAFGLPFFDPERGGDPLLWQHLFWLFGHPEVYIIFLPAAGAISTVLPVFAGRPLMGYRWVVIAAISMAFISFGLWVHHMYMVGISHMAMAFFSAASALVAVPTAIQIFAWLATLAHGRPRFSVPMLYVFGFFFVFVIGGLTGVMLAMMPFDKQAHDTHFVVAHFHYVLIGGFVFPMLAAAYYWLPLITGKRPVHHLSLPAFWLVFIGFNVTFLVMHLTGLLGMVRRVHTYTEASGLEIYNLVSSIGAFVMTIGFALVLIDIVLQVRYGRAFPRTPWKAMTLEWAMPKPAPAYNFASLPRVDRRADMLAPERLGRELAAGEGYLGFARDGRMETLAVGMASGRLEQVVLLPRQTFLPLFTAAATGLFFIAMLAKLYWLVPIALLATLALFLGWTRATGSGKDSGALPVGRDAQAPPHTESRNAPSWWAMVFTLAADATLYASLLFGGWFLWLSAPNWPPATLPEPGMLLSAAAIAALLAAGAAGWRARHLAGAHPQASLALCAAAHGLATLAIAWIAMTAIPDRMGHALSATCFVVLCYAGFHTALGVVFALFGLWRGRQGLVSAVRCLDLRIGKLWHLYTAGAGIAAVIFVHVFIMLGAGGGAP